MRRLIDRCLMIVVLMMIAGPLQADDHYPAELVKIYVPSSPGGSTDAIARVFAKHFEQVTGSAVAIVNQTGGGGVIAAHSVARSKPNGGTLLLYHTALHVSHALGRSPYQYKDFTPLATLSMVNDVYAVRADAPYKTLQELLDYTRKHEGKITVGSQFGATTQIKGQALTQLYPEGFRVVDSGSESKRITALLGEKVDLISMSVASALQFERNGDVRILGVMNNTPDAFAPDWPTAPSQGVPAHLPQVFAVYGPAELPQPIIDQFDRIMAGIQQDLAYQEAIRKVRQSPEYRNHKDAAIFLADEYRFIEKVVNP
ncbi:tripartite-type tricarboxylate transporter receptor subunit TctC [Marinimicrobium koreense]|uniref:Tripartite-type tricarboxylate transporter receptor subunit TctC n=1 Tax=Marinimicrobium koreense TaxID=306545 RepID=A0A3N1P135_9GAMM|nr:tripartite tricarboxylate transporter substrate binding protein [Marinimicrobium koreense]ROQ20967.1 tripartite-type tricarboxylate transporter receptor subunit TctC [Marinimicrobium koreense]